VSRLESQVTRFQEAAESAEQSELELKAEKKKLIREVRISLLFHNNFYFNVLFHFQLQLREAKARIEELETSNRHLEGRMEKLKTAKSNLLKEL